MMHIPFSVEQKVIPCAQDTEQKHGKHFSIFSFSHFSISTLDHLATLLHLATSTLVHFYTSFIPFFSFFHSFLPFHSYHSFHSFQEWHSSTHGTCSHSVNWITTYARCTDVSFQTCICSSRCLPHRFLPSSPLRVRRRHLLPLHVFCAYLYVSAVLLFLVIVGRSNWPAQRAFEGKWTRGRRGLCSACWCWPQNWDCLVVQNSDDAVSLFDSEVHYLASWRSFVELLVCHGIVHVAVWTASVHGLGFCADFTALAGIFSATDKRVYGGGRCQFVAARSTHLWGVELRRFSSHDKVTMIFLENQTGLFHHLMTHIRICPVKREMTLVHVRKLHLPPSRWTKSWTLLTERRIILSSTERHWRLQNYTH